MPNNKISYRPSFDYEKSYDTIGNRNYDSSIQVPPSDNATNPATQTIIGVPDIVTKINSISALYTRLPVDIAGIIHGMILGITQSLPYIDTNNLPNRNTNDDEDNDSDIEQDSNNTNESRPSSSDNLNNIPPSYITSPTIEQIRPSPAPDNDPNKNWRITTTIKGKRIGLPKPRIIKNTALDTTPNVGQKKNNIVDAFDYTMLLIYNKFLTDVQDLIVNYNLNISYGSTYGNVTNLNGEFTTNTSSVERDLKHLSDNIIRSEIQYDQEIRLAKKMFSIKNCINHFNAIYASKEFYNRYAEENYQQEFGAKNNYINQSLTNTLNMYYNKYLSNLTNIYKYYNSCGVIIGECLNMKAQSFVSKNIIS